MGRRRYGRLARLGGRVGSLSALPLPNLEPGRFLAAAQAAARSRRPSAGLCDDLRLRGDRVVGSGLALDGELVQLCAFSAEQAAQATRITRTQRRSR